jgi:hypothetical protein
MKSKKTSLILRAVLIAALTILIIAQPDVSNGRKWLRFAMLIFFVVTFIIDFTKYKKDNAA